MTKASAGSATGRGTCRCAEFVQIDAVVTKPNACSGNVFILLQVAANELAIDHHCGCQPICDAHQSAIARRDQVAMRTLAGNGDRVREQPGYRYAEHGQRIIERVDQPDSALANEARQLPGAGHGLPRSEGIDGKMLDRDAGFLKIPGTQPYRPKTADYRCEFRTIQSPSNQGHLPLAAP